jgi:hypothetical protein
MDGCKLLAVHDTSTWASSLGYTVKTITGLDAIDNNHLVGVDRDSMRLFSVEFDDAGHLIGGRAFFLDAPGPAPLPSDGCPPLTGLPRLIMPALESVAVVPGRLDDATGEPAEYRVYLAVDPWAPGWAVAGSEWDCPGYEARLRALLPALYRYTVSADVLLPPSG